MPLRRYKPRVPFSTASSWVETDGLSGGRETVLLTNWLQCQGFICGLIELVPVQVPVPVLASARGLECLLKSPCLVSPSLFMQGLGTAHCDGHVDSIWEGQ